MDNRLLYMDRDIGGLMRKRYNPIANVLELHLFCFKHSIFSTGRKKVVMLNMRSYLVSLEVVVMTTFSVATDDNAPAVCAF